MTSPFKPSNVTDLTVQKISALNLNQQTELRKMWLHSTALEANAIGWLPVAAYDTRAANDQIIAVYRNEDLVGWSMAVISASRAVLKLYQIWVRPDARIIDHGRALVQRLQARSEKARCHLIEAWVAEDLPANLFWQAIGFTRTNWRWGRGNNPRKHWRWITHTPIIRSVYDRAANNA